MISHAADLLVIGAGAAGLRAAIALDDEHARVLVVCWLDDSHVPAKVNPSARCEHHTLLDGGGARCGRRGGAPVPAGPNWLRTIVVSGRQGRLELSAMPLLAPSAAVAKGLPDTREPHH